MQKLPNLPARSQSLIGRALRALSQICLLIIAGAGLLSASAAEPGEGFINVPGGPVWYHIVGDGEGVPLLLLHGGPGGTSCGYSRFEVLGGERPVVRYDQLGTGRSGRPDDLSLWTAEHYVEELQVLRDSLGLDEVHLLGHSWGAALAAAYVIEKGGEGIVSLTLSSPLLSTPAWVKDANTLRATLPVEVQEVLSQHEAAGTTDSEEYQEASQAFYRRFVYAGDRPPAVAACDGVTGNRQIYRHMWGPTEFYATGNLRDFDLEPRLGEIDVPVLLVTGEFDEARPETVSGFRDRIRGAEFAVIAGVAHASYSKAMDDYLAVLRPFLAAAEAAR